MFRIIDLARNKGICCAVLVLCCVVACCVVFVVWRAVLCRGEVFLCLQAVPILCCGVNLFLSYICFSQILSRAPPVKPTGALVRVLWPGGRRQALTCLHIGTPYLIQK